VEAVVMCGVDCLALGNAMHGPSSASSFVCLSGSRASYLLRKGTWGGEGGREAICLLPRAGTRFHCPLSLRSSPSAWWQEGRGSSASHGASILCACFGDGRAWVHQPISLSHSLMLLNLSTSSLSSATRLSRSSTWSQRTQAFCPLPSDTTDRYHRQAQALPAARDPHSCLFMQELCLGRHTPPGDGFQQSADHSSISPS